MLVNHLHLHLGMLSQSFRKHSQSKNFTESCFHSYSFSGLSALCYENSLFYVCTFLSAGARTHFLLCFFSRISIIIHTKTTASTCSVSAPTSKAIARQRDKTMREFIEAGLSEKQKEGKEIQKAKEGGGMLLRGSEKQKAKRALKRKNVKLYIY